MSEGLVELTPFQEYWDYQSYDKALAAWLQKQFTIDGSPIPLTFATPDRAFAQMAKKFNLKENQPVPLPFISLQQVGDAVPDPKRRLSYSIYERVGETYNSDGSLKGALIRRWPIPYNFTYTAELWCKTRMEARGYLRSYAEAFEHGDYTYLTVDHGDGIGQKLVRVENQGITDNTNLESGQEQRTLRWALTLVVYGWLPRRLEEVKVIQRVNITFEEMR